MTPWKKKARRAAIELLALRDIWDEDDPYDLAEAARVAIAAGQSPEAFVREQFAEDLARADGAQQEHLDSLEESDIDGLDGLDVSYEPAEEQSEEDNCYECPECGSSSHSTCNR
jgi:hypothetical protein